MKNKISFIVALVFGIITVSKSQDIPIQVLNSAGGGGSVGTTGVEAYYNIGETVIATNSSSFAIATQGFLQPCFIGEYGLWATTAFNGVSCVGKTDGLIAISPTVSSTVPGVLSSAFVYSYYWSPASICPTNDCATVNGLPPGTYSVLVISQYTGAAAIPDDSLTITDIIISDNFSPCLLEIFNGVTPNGDNHNDYFHIGNIDQYPDNTVDIYNRWGQIISHIEKYDNIDRKWSGTLNGSGTAPSGTYFYIIHLNDKKSKPIKGWIELLNN